MKFNREKLNKLAKLDDVEQEIFTPEEIQEIHAGAAQRAQVRQSLSEQISKVITSYMAQEQIGFNEFQRRLGVSSATASKLIKGDGNVTLETIASVSQLIGMTPKITFKKRA
ncbi:MAG: helix-turn-helix domain-containing protein [Oligoflexus sp.]